LTGAAGRVGGRGGGWAVGNLLPGFEGMGEHILTSCPACGLGVRADPDISSFKCPNCGYVFYVSNDPAAAPAAPAQRFPRWGLVVLTIVAPLLISGLAICAALDRGDRQSHPGGP
jgi:hypothetical protein